MLLPSHSGDLEIRFFFIFFKYSDEVPNTIVVVIEVVVSGFTALLTSQVISVAFYSECEKSDKFCFEALISA